MSSFVFEVHALLVRQGLEKLDAATPRVGRERIYKRMLAIKQTLSKAPPKPTYPLDWDSVKQRIAYFASNGFGHGIPYRRSGKHIAAWLLRALADGYSLLNKELTAYYVWGDVAPGKTQSNIHRGRWPHSAPTVKGELALLPVEIQSDIQAAIKAAGL